MLRQPRIATFCRVAGLALLIGCSESPSGGLDTGALVVDAQGMGDAADAAQDASDVADLGADAGLLDAVVSDGGVTDSGATDAALTDAGDPADSGDSGDAGDTTDVGAPADVGNPGDAGTTPDAGVNSRCAQTPSRIACTYSTRTLRIGTTALTDRDVHYELPDSPAPAAGYPVVIAFQGSFTSAELVWNSARNAAFGRYHMSATVKELLDRGYAVLTPEAHIGGTTFWDTNVPPYAVFWETSNDHRFMQLIFEDIADGDFGNLDATRLYATGISSGGYMTSRMAVSYPGTFKALAIHSGSYATCGGALCLLPSMLPAGHPPTLFAHGAADAIVPIATMQAYADQLIAEGFAIDVVVNQTAGHEWLEEATLPIADWFDAHP